MVRRVADGWRRRGLALAVWSQALIFIGGVAAGVLVAAAVSRAVLRRSLRRMRRAEQRARGAERLAEIGAMTGGLAHEIKNPLSTIGLNAQLLGESVEELALAGEERGRLIRRTQALRREVDRLRGILTDFLEYAGELRLDRKRADMNQVVGELVDFFLPEAEKHSVRLRADLAPGELAVIVDVPHIKQAVLNLMLNAVQAMASAGGTATGERVPAVMPRELILKTLRTKGDGNAVQLHVIDTGPGIPPETAAKIFTPYFTTKSGGTGLGLPTARRLVEAHGGTLEVFTEIGRGTDFVITLPGNA